jgi:hypothetical protein
MRKRSLLVIVVLLREFDSSTSMVKGVTEDREAILKEEY